MRRRLHFARDVRGEHGITGLETAIVMIAFVVVASVFAFVVLSTGLFASERGRDTIFAALAKTRGSMALTGGVIATSNQTKITTITLDVTLAAGGDSVNLDPASTNDKTIISFADDSVTSNSLTYTTAVVTGNSDKVLEAGELLELTITLPSAANVVANRTFTLEVKPPSGSTMLIQRTSPASILQTIINLN
jgi:archaeal flagellin FlaB